MQRSQENLLMIIMFARSRVLKLTALGFPLSFANLLNSDADHIELSVT